MVSENYKNKIKKSIKTKFSEMGVDDDTINELVNVSIESLEAELQAIEEILNSDNIDELGFHTHTIKGILLNVGLNEDANNFKEIKHLIGKKTNDEIKEITQKRISVFKG